jgi:hypothetical protein
MSVIDGGLQAVFGAAFAALYADGVLHSTTTADDGADSFTASATDVPIKVLVESLSDRDRAAAGLPRTAVTLSVLAAGLGATIALDDSITVGSASYRVVQVDMDAAQSSYAVIGVPA